MKPTIQASPAPPAPPAPPLPPPPNVDAERRLQLMESLQKILNVRDNWTMATAWLAERCAGNTGHVDFHGLTKYFPFTAQDLRLGNVTAEQVGHALVQLYVATTPPEERRAKDEVLFHTYSLAVRALGPETIKENFENRFIANFAELLELNLRQILPHLTAPIEKVPLGRIQQCIEQVCEFYGPYFDRHFHGGEIGAFLAACPLHHMCSNHLERTLDDCSETFLTEGILETKLTDTCHDIVAGKDFEHVFCWECDTVIADYNSMVRCSGCLCPAYCGHACQSAAWSSGHSSKCAALNAMHSCMNESLQEVDRVYGLGVVCPGHAANPLMDLQVLFDMLVEFPDQGILGRYPSMKCFYESVRLVLNGNLWYAHAAPERPYIHSRTMQNQQEQPSPIHPFEMDQFYLICFHMACGGLLQKVEQQGVSGGNAQVESRPAVFPWGVPMPAARFLDHYYNSFSFPMLDQRDWMAWKQQTISALLQRFRNHCHK